MIQYFKQHIFGRFALLFLVAGTVLVVLTYYVSNWAVSDKDNILDMHDAYYHYKFVESWKDFSDTTQIRKELNNLHILGKIYSLQADTLCTENYVFDIEKEKELLYWTNTSLPFSLCDYMSYQWSTSLASHHNVVFDGYVSFGDISLDTKIYPATVIEHGPYQVLLIIPGYVYPNEWLTFLPVGFLSMFFMLLLYVLLRLFLRPISLMQNRIYALERGDLDSEIKIIGHDELALLSKNFNTLIQEIKKLLKQKERLLAEVSHEIRSPLAKIRLLLAMDKPEKNMARINKQIEALDSLVTNILISDKLAAPYSNLKIERISIENLIKQALELSKNKRVKILKRASFKVSCDAVKLSIVIKNLLENAEKYAPSKKGFVLFYTKEEGLATIGVRDFGPGVSEDIIDKITQPYVRGTNLQKAGFGLGLSICKRVMVAHQGTLSVSNNKDGGTTFTAQWNSRNLKEDNCKKIV